MAWALSEPKASSASKAALWHAAKAVWPERMQSAKEPSVPENARPYWEKYALCRELLNSREAKPKSRRRI